MDGIILINKPSKISSYDVIRKIKKDLPKKDYKIKIGHAGTLDPLATGLLIVLVGKATKLSNYFTNHKKTYEGKIAFGKYYDTLDLEGDLLYQKTPNISIKEIKLLEKKLSLYSYMQIPPKYSAVKINGKRSYDLARKNINFKLKPAKVIINYFEIKKFKDNTITFKTEVSKGTYIRSLARDIGLFLNEYAYLQELKRVKSATFNINMANSLDNYKIIPLKKWLKENKEIYNVGPKLEKLIRNGVTLDNRNNDINFKYDFVCVNNKENVIAYYQKNNLGKYKPIIIF